MKTPRDILFARHQSSEPKLDAIRRSVVARGYADSGRDQAGESVGFLTRLWLELVWPCRRIWTGLAAVWVLLFIVNVSQRDDSHALSAKSAAPIGMMMAYRGQEKILAELLEDWSQPREADRPRNFVPKPRSEISGTAAV
jgi:hypothetical protein